MKALLTSLFLSGMLVVLGTEPRAQRATSGYSGYGVRASIHGAHSGYAPSRVWIPGRYDTVCKPVWVPSCEERVWVEPIYELRHDHCGNVIRVQVCAGYWRISSRPGRYEMRSVQIWCPGHWATRGIR